MAIDVAATRAAIASHRGRLLSTRAAATQAIGEIWRAVIPQEPVSPAELAAAQRTWMSLAVRQVEASQVEAASDAIDYVRAYAVAAGAGRAVDLRRIDPRDFAGETGTDVPLLRQIVGPVIEMRTRLGQGREWPAARRSGDLRARRDTSTLIVRASDQAANRSAKASGFFRGWRRVVSSQNPCGACLAAAGATVRSLDDPLEWHPGCRCSRAFLPSGEPDEALSFIPTGENLFARMSPEEQARLFAGRGGAEKAALVRDGEVPLEALMRDSGRGRTSEATMQDLDRIAAARRARGIDPRPLGSG